METDFGIIPYPKYDSAQDRYYSRLSYYIPTIVPTTNQELEMTGAIFEALNAESHRTVLPTYIETMLKVRNSRDEESESMIDLIFNTLVVDIGDTTLCSYVRDNFIASMFYSNNRNFASTVEKQTPRIEKELEKMLITE